MIHASLMPFLLRTKDTFILGVFLSEISSVLKLWNSVGKPKEASVGSTHVAEVLRCSVH